MKFSMKVDSGTISTIEGMEGWMKALQEDYGIEAKEFSINFKSFIRGDHRDGNVYMIGSLKSFINLWKDYHRYTTIKIGW